MDTVAKSAPKNLADLKSERGGPDPLEPPVDPAKVEVLRGICAGELLEAFGLDEIKRGRRVFEALARRSASRLAYKAAVYDEIVGEAGLGAGGAWALGEMAREVEFSGVDAIPRRGPLLIVSNHPGLSDTLALFAAIPREDLKVVAAGRPFLTELTHTSRRLLTVDGDSKERFALIRGASKHMKDGGSLLTFPGGGIEPDPALFTEAVESLESWSGSLDLFTRLVPDLRVVPVVVSGVLSPGALANPLKYLRRRKEDQRWLAATFQMLSPKLYGTRVRVEFGKVFQREGDREISGAVLRETRRMISTRRESPRSLE